MIDRDKSLNKALDKIQKAYGKGAVMTLGEEAKTDIEVIPTGSLSLNRALGIGGLPKGRIVEIYGDTGTGKTSQTLHLIANAQKAGGLCVFIDMEHALDPVWASKLGVDIENLYVSQPTTGEDALEISEALIRTGAIDLLVIDSVAALTPKAEIEGEMGESKMGLHARLMSQGMRKLTAAISKSNCCVVFLNQTRSKIGVVYGDPTTTTGGNALKFYSSIRLQTYRGTVIKEGTDVIGYRNKIKVVKNKLAPPFKTAEFDFLFTGGVDYYAELRDIAVELGVLDKKGSYYKYKGDTLAQGSSKIADVLRDNPELVEQIQTEIDDLSK